MTWLTLNLLLGLVLLPVVPTLVDVLPGIRASRRDRFVLPVDVATIEDFTVLVPIYGSIRYLETVDFLATYGSRVWLCTTTSETPEFYDDLRRVADAHGFRVHTTECSGQSTPGKRQVAGTTRDQIIQDATRSVSSEYVVCIDADTRTIQPLGELVNALAANDLDLASVRLYPSNTDRLLGRLQRYEYRMSMRMRRLMPALCSGALQVSRASAHKRIMQRHTLFFQGNDAEMGLLGDRLGFRVGYLPVDVPTVVPERFWPWWRQRLAWAGGEFRLYIVNIRLIRTHPFFILYGAVVVFGLWPARVYLFAHPTFAIVTVLVVYGLTVLAINWRQRSWTLAVYPFYGLFINMVLVPLGVVSYVQMARASHNAGLIYRPSASRDRIGLGPGPTGGGSLQHAPDESA